MLRSTRILMLVGLTTILTLALNPLAAEAKSPGGPGKGSSSYKNSNNLSKHTTQTTPYKHLKPDHDKFPTDSKHDHYVNSHCKSGKYCGNDYCKPGCHDHCKPCWDHCWPSCSCYPCFCDCYTIGWWGCQYECDDEVEVVSCDGDE
jgi:hypothetical protein